MNKRKLSLLGLTILCGALVVGCTAQRGAHELSGLSHEEIEDSIQDGSTTKQEIVAKFGSKYSMEEDVSGLEKWIYELNTARAKGASYIPYVNLFASGTKNKDYKLIVVFDKNDTVIRHRFHANEYETSQWKK